MSQNVLGANSWPIVGLGNYYPAALGVDYSADTLSVGVRTTAQTYQNLVVAPIFTGLRPITIDRWTIHVATAAAAAVYRIGVWTLLNQSDPFKWAAGSKYAKLTRDVGAATGTIDCSTTGSKTLADSVTLPANTWVLIGGALQGATGANLTIGTNVSGVHSPYGLVTLAAGINGAAAVGLAQSGQAGAFGDFTPTGAANVGHGVAFRRSA